MFPYNDNLSDDRRSWAVTCLILILILINAPLLLVPAWHADAIRYFGFFPLQFSQHAFLNSYRLITASFLHGDIFHLAGNCLFLFVFGRTLERLFGFKLLVGLFPVLGIAGFLLEWELYPDSTVPIIGSSGAIAALMGAYLPLFPKARVRMVIFYAWFWKRFTVPAWIFLPYWGGLQLLSIALNSQDGVAYGVHAGSFAAGAIIAIAWKTSYPLADEKLQEFNSTSFDQS